MKHEECSIKNEIFDDNESREARSAEQITAKRNNNESREAISTFIEINSAPSKWQLITTNQPNKIQQKGDCPGRDFALSLLHAGTN